MVSKRNAAVWIDHHEAHVLHVNGEIVDEKTIAAAHDHPHRHPKGPLPEHEHPDDVRRFFGEVADALADADVLLVLGPSTAKHQFVRYLHDHRRALEAKVVAVETMDHPSGRQLAAHVKRAFEARESPLRA